MWDILKNRGIEFLAHCVGNNKIFLLSGGSLGWLYGNENPEYIYKLFTTLIASEFTGYFLLFLSVYSVCGILLSVINFGTDKTPLFGPVHQDYRDFVRVFFGVSGGFIITYSVKSSFNLLVISGVVFIEFLLFMIYFLSIQITVILHQINSSGRDGVKVKSCIAGVLILVLFTLLVIFRVEIMAVLKP